MSNTVTDTMCEVLQHAQAYRTTEHFVSEDHATTRTEFCCNQVASAYTITVARWAADPKWYADQLKGYALAIQLFDKQELNLILKERSH